MQDKQGFFYVAGFFRRRTYRRKWEIFWCNVALFGLSAVNITQSSLTQKNESVDFDQQKKSIKT